MSSRLFFALLASIWIAAAFALFVSLYSLENQMPSGPCVSSVENGDFINDAFHHYRFNGSITFWPQEQSVTVFGFVVTDGQKSRLRREMRLQALDKHENRMIFSVQSLDVDSSDQLSRHDVFFSEPGQKLYMSVKKLSANEFMYFINDNWVFMCRVR